MPHASTPAPAADPSVNTPVWKHHDFLYSATMTLHPKTTSNADAVCVEREWYAGLPAGAYYIPVTVVVHDAGNPEGSMTGGIYGVLYSEGDGPDSVPSPKLAMGLVDAQGQLVGSCEDDIQPKIQMKSGGSAVFKGALPVRPGQPQPSGSIYLTWFTDDGGSVKSWVSIPVAEVPVAG